MNVLRGGIGGPSYPNDQNKTSRVLTYPSTISFSVSSLPSLLKVVGTASCFGLTNCARGGQARQDPVGRRWSDHVSRAEAIGGRAVANGGTAGLITYDIVERHLAQLRPMPAGITVGHFGKVRGSNAVETAAVIIVIGRNLPPFEVLEDEAASVFALDPDGRTVKFGAGMQRLEQGLRVAGCSDGVACLTEVPACPLVRLIYDEIVVEEVQALGRGRGARRTADKPVLLISINNVVADVTYDDVVTWDVFADLCESGAALHAFGVLPDKPGDIKPLIPHMFSDGVEAERVARNLAKDWCADDRVTKIRTKPVRSPMYGLYYR